MIVNTLITKITNKKYILYIIISCTYLYIKVSNFSNFLHKIYDYQLVTKKNFVIFAKNFVIVCNF